MMLKVNNQYLDLDLSIDNDIIIDKQSKSFEKPDQTSGDFSYEFTLPATANNLAIFNSPFPDTANKTIFKNVGCEILDNDGLPLYIGFLRFEGISKRKIKVNFFSGNANWSLLLQGNISELDFSEYDTHLTETNIINYRTRTDGVIFPLIDNGTLASRSTENLFVEDFTGAIYVKTIFRKIFYRHGLKIKGDLMNDWLFNNLIICKNNKNKDQLAASSCYILKSTTTNRPTELVDYKVTFDDDSTFPYFDGSSNSFDLANSKYIAPYKMTAKVEISLRGSFTDHNYNNRIQLYINGAFTFVDVGLSVGGLYNSATPGDQTDFTLERTITLEAGDELEVYSNWQESTGSTTPINIVSGTMKITPVYIYQTLGNDLVPNWKQSSFVASIFQFFNVLCDYNPISKTITFDLFEKLKTKTSIDISKYVDPETIETDFTEFIATFGKKNYLSYNEGDDEDLREYNVKEIVKYGAGVIEVDNDFLNEEIDLIDSGFTSPISYVNTVFGASIERLNFLQLESESNTDFTAVTNSSGIARFTITNQNFLVGDLVRIEDSTIAEYNGDWIVSVRGSGYIELTGQGFIASAIGKISKLTHRYTDSDSIFVLVHVPNYSISDFSSLTNYYLNGTSYSALSYGYFNMLKTTVYKQGLSFGAVNNPLSYQMTLIDKYWISIQSMLNDPVKVTADFYFPRSVFRQLTPLTPVYLKTEQTTNMYYVEVISGYRGSSKPCQVELIKL
jgi:hypothetical protein